MIDLFTLEDEVIVSLKLSVINYNLFFNKTKSLEPVVKYLINSLNLTKEIDIDIIRSIVTNTARMIRSGGKGLSIPRNNNFYSGKHNKQKLSRTAMFRVLDQLEGLGYLTNYKGYALINKENGEIEESERSFTIIEDKMSCLFTKLNLLCCVSNSMDKSEIIIRDRETHEDKSLRGVTGVAELKQKVKELNTVLDANEISYCGNRVPEVYYSRIFADDLSHAGRFYSSDGRMSCLQQRYRSQLKINNEPVVELDYSSLHASMLYETIKDFDLPDDFKAYQADISKYVTVDKNKVEEFKKKHNLKSYDPIKNLCKKVLLVSLNIRGDIRNAAGAVTADIRSDWKCKNEADKKYVGLCFTKVDGEEHIFSKDICSAVLEHNYMIADYFYSDAGIMLQYRDSTIAQFVVDEFVADGEAILVYHDSFVVRESLEQKLETCMKKAYKYVVGSDRYCKIDKK